ncbi:MAG: sigma-70 family RNA polymerase sigma factor [Planctomycetaceae bacterium]|nr:sigma-70 family RNA polymerase sigma factor [Planctomycetaceae bacterium]
MQPGHSTRLAEIYRDYRLSLVAMATNIIGCRHRAEDAVHDAFARMVQTRTIQSTAEIVDLVAYCFRSVRNSALNVAQKHSSQQGALRLYYEVQQSANDAGVAAAFQEELIALLEQLPLEQRELIVLKVHANLTFAQIGEIQNTPLKTVATRYRRTIEELRSKLEKVYDA